ncbi:probable arabinosyltransferase ARAD1 [Cynara cardunculus var. scolymus]|uniref:probable arabinosyltransferase ARAD1 n=1 Tax=Cynara cardunculus var. scolymus TaxID=59895 RepID=UPI000D624C18|nr:probable arabinosyltransferase ARAD1 [Cynara cardunculus var. scolymus]
MSDRNVGSSSFIGFLSMKSLLGLFSIALVVFILSWFLLLGSTGRSRFIDHNLLPHSMRYDNYMQKAPKRSAPLMDHKKQATLRVFMYDLPSEFHFEIIDWNPEGKTVWPDLRVKVPEYPGGLNLQHSVAYWLTLDLLASEFSENGGRIAVRVHNSSEADVIFVPFFSSVCFNRYSRTNPHQKTNKNKDLQQKLVKYLTVQPEWQRSGGIDHLIVAHHPNSLLDARMQLWPAMFILSDFGRYPPTIANIDKDVIAPYKHVIRNYVNDSSGFDSRPILLFFQGAIYRKDGGFIRQEIFYLLKKEKDVHFAFGSVKKQGVVSATKGMRLSKFCLNIAGDTPSSNRLFDAIASHCVPVIISDEIELPFEDILDYSEFSVFVRTSDALKDEFLINFIRSIGRDEWTQKWAKLKEVERFFEYQYPSKNGDAVQMIWRAVSKKVPIIKRKLHAAKRRFSRFDQPAPAIAALIR